MQAYQRPVPMPFTSRRRIRAQQGFGLLELSIAVVIIGIISTLALPNLLESLDRGRQSSTKADMRSIATALERFAVDHQAYPVVDDFAELRPDLVPKYLKELPLTDGWKHPFSFETDEHGTTYTLSSPGKDGTFQEGEVADAELGFGLDIVCVDGVLLDASSTRQEQTG
ncbi:MAG: type II secretion system protein GspG [Acidobacteriota bacterium]